MIGSRNMVDPQANNLTLGKLEQTVKKLEKEYVFTINREGT